MYRSLSLFVSLISLTFSTAAWAMPAEGVEGKKMLFSVSYDEAEAAVGNTLVSAGAGDKIAARINGRSNNPLFSYSKPMTVELRGVQFDKRAGHWTGSLLAMSEGQVLTAVPASGRFDEMAEIPVIKRAVRNTEIISNADIEVRDFPARMVRGDTITDMAALIGKSPVYTISPDRPVRMHEIAAPKAVKQNTIVQMEYHSPGMTITTTGQATEDGAVGAVINIRNLTSKRLVQATVVDAQTVRIGAVPMAKTATPDNKTVQLNEKASLGDLYATN